MTDKLDAVICDFGISRVLEDVPTGLTTSGSYKGTSRYSSPELLVADEPKTTIQSDIWAWGCLFLRVSSRTFQSWVLTDAHLVMMWTR